jgi:DNA-binding NarL/FixJ family response regulator
MSIARTRSVRTAKHNQDTDKPVRVLICATSSLACAELERLLEPQSGVYIVGAVASAVGLAFAISEKDPDVLILQLPAQPHAIHWEELTALGVPIVLLVEGTDLVNPTAAMAAGVQAVIARDARGAELAAACASTACGLLTLSRDLADFVRHELAAISQEDPDDSPDGSSGSTGLPEHLTLREREVLEMMSEGLSNKEIAARLNISTNTVKFHISSILGKLGASSRTEAAAIGLRRGLITI